MAANSTTQRTPGMRATQNTVRKSPPTASSRKASAGPIKAPAVSRASWKPNALPRSCLPRGPRCRYRRHSGSAISAAPKRRRSSSDDLQRFRPEGAAVALGDEGVGVHRLAFRDRHDHIHVSGPRPLGVESGRLRGVVGVAVVVADDVVSVRVGLALDADVIAWIDLVTVARPFDNYVASASRLGRRLAAARADEDATDLVGIALRAVRPDRLDRRAADLHRRP